MTSFLKTTALALTAIFALSTTAQAVPILLKYTGTGSGSIDTTNFTDADFVITALGDTDNRIVGMAGPNPLIELDHDSASISIDGVGTFDFITPTRTFANDVGPYSIVGFSRSPDLFNGLLAPAGWEMLTSIGPVASDALLFQWNNSPVVTDGGTLVFNDDFSVPATFSATVGPVPAPGAALLLGFGVMGVVAVKQRKQQSVAWRKAA